MKTQRSDHSMELDGMFAGRAGAGSGEGNYRDVARSGNMGGSMAPVKNLPIVSGLGAVDVTVDTSTILMGLAAVGLGVVLYMKFGR